MTARTDAALPQTQAPKPERDGAVPTPSGNGARVSAERPHGFVAVNLASLRRDSLRRRSLAVADVAALCAGYVCVALVRPLHAPLKAELALLAALPVFILLNKLRGLYDRDPALINKSTLDELPQLLESVVIGATLLYFLWPLVPNLYIDRGHIIVFVTASALLLPMSRGITRRAVSRRTSPERCVIVGSGAVAQLLARKIRQHPEYGVELVGFIDEAWAQPVSGGVSRLGHITEFEELCRELGVERVVISFSTLSHDDLLDVISMSKRLSLKVSIVPRLFEAVGHGVEIDQVEGMVLLGMRAVMRTKSSLLLKRSIDVLVSGTGLILLSPVLLAIAVAIKLTSRGPILFSQWRIGRDEHAFRMVKFRTMYTGSDSLKQSLAHLNEATTPMFKIAKDPRVTPAGLFLRRFSLDELPQLWNVLRGEMSLVGPRPLVPDEDDHVLGRHRARLDITPGLTGPWQVMGRTAIPFAEMMKLDYLYVAEWSLWNDLKLLIRTAPVVLFGRGH
jgi:exopolysaccharide biosynthesis polyprenyl glycosylphosphotransferase